MKLRSVPILNPPAFLIFSTLFEVLVTSALKKFTAGTVLEPTNKLLATLAVPHMVAESLVKLFEYKFTPSLIIEYPVRLDLGVNESLLIIAIL